MSTPLQYQKRIETLKKEYDRLKIGEESLLKIIDENLMKVWCKS